MTQLTTAGDVRVVTSEAEKKYGLPEGTLFKMSGIESNHTPNAVSPKGAAGWFQFMPATAKEYGLDDPSDLTKSADAAGRKMGDLMRNHSGNLDFALVDYNGGHKAVKALIAGKPWEESAGYLSKFHGKSQDEIAQGYRPGPMGEQFTSQTTSSPVDGPSASSLVFADQKQAKEYGGVSGFVSHFPEAEALGFVTQSATWNYFKESAIQGLGEPLDWASKEAKDTLAEFPERHRGYLEQSVTKEELAQRSTRLRQTMSDQQELGQMGLPLAITGGILGGLFSAETIPLLLFTGGASVGAVAANATVQAVRAARVVNAVRMASVGGVSNVVLDAIANQYKPTATTEDLYMSALMGMGLGGIGGLAVNPRHVGLREENLRLREYGLKQHAAGLRKEVDDVLKGPTIAPLLPEGGHAEYLKKLDEWAGGLGRNPPEKPVMAILRGGPEDLPTAPKGRVVEEPGLPLRGDLPEGGRVPEVNPNGKPWEPKWDEPVRVTRLDAPEILMLPPLKKISHLAEYVREFSTNKDITALMDRALKGIDLRKLKFDVIDPKVDPRTLQVSGKTARNMDNAFGVVLTPHGSNGDGIEMALRGNGWGQAKSGLNEETFVHELLHVATVYKWHKVHTGNTEGMRRETIQAYKELDSLYRTVQKHGKTLAVADLPDRFKTNMANPREFISYGLTNRPFQEFLKTVQIEGAQSTLWGQFTASLRKMLGMTQGEGHAYAKMIDLTEGLLDKSGVEGKRKTRADYAAKSAFIDPEDVTAANAADLPPVFGFGLGLEHRLMGEKSPQAVRDLSANLIGTTVGHKGHAVVRRNAWDDTIAKAEGWTAETRKTGFSAFNTWFSTQQRPWHEKGQAFEEFGEQVSNYVRGFPGDFSAEVKTAGQKIREMNARINDEINNPAHTEGGSKRGLTEVEVLDPATGLTALEGKLEKNPNYLPRKHDSQKWDEAVGTWGREAVESWWANAYAKVHPERTAEDAAKWAGWYTRTVEEAHMNRSTDHLEEMMSGFDEKALKESLVRNGGFTEGEAFGIVQGMFQKPGNDAGRTSSSLRHRNHISESHSETWRTKDGVDVEMTLNDFIRSNAFEVQEAYYKRTASSIALANRMDIYKQSDIGRMIDEATNKGFGSKVSDADAVKARNDLKFSFDRVQGIPQEEWSALNKSLETWRDFNVIRLMGGAVWNQATELSQIVGTMGWKATLGAVGELKAIRRDIATGKAPHDLLDHLENTIGGVGSEYVSRLDFGPKDDWVRHKGDSAANRRLDALDTGMKKVAKGVLDYTGMTGLMVQQKRVHAIALTNHFVNAANGPASKFLSKDRLAWMGMSEADYAGLNAAIKTYSKEGKGEFSKKIDFDFKAFAAAEPEKNSMLMNALHRESRRAVQENDLASMIPIMGTTLGKTVFQFMNFTMHGWNKSMNFGMNHRDFSTLSTVLHGSFFASLAYMGRTQLSSLGMNEEQRMEFLDKRMAPKQIVANSFGKISQASLLPQIYDSTLGNFTGPQFSGARTTSDVSSIASNPTLQAVNGVLSLGKMARNGMSDTEQTSQRDIKTWAKLVPLNNVAPISTFLNALANDYPTSTKQDE